MAQICNTEVVTFHTKISIIEQPIRQSFCLSLFPLSQATQIPSKLNQDKMTLFCPLV